MKRLTFPEASVYVLGKSLESLVGRSFEILGLRRVDSGLDPDFDGLFLALEGPGTGVLLPSALQQALLASADLFVSSAAKRGRHSPRVCLRLSSSGWALLVPEPIFMDLQMRAFLETADRVSEALS